MRNILFLLFLTTMGCAGTSATWDYCPKDGAPCISCEIHENRVENFPSDEVKRAWAQEQLIGRN